MEKLTRWNTAQKEKWQAGSGSYSFGRGRKAVLVYQGRVQTGRVIIKK